MVRNERGLTLIELMIVVIVIGLLAAIAYPLYSNFSNRARVASVKSNMHTLHVTVEDFATRNNGLYPQNAAATTLDGGYTLMSLLPAGTMPTNPFTNNSTALDWSNALGTPPATDPLGGVSLNTVQSTPGGVWDTYEIVGNDNDAVPLSLVLGNS